MESECLYFFHQAFSGPYPEPAASSLNLHILYHLDHCKCYSFVYNLACQVLSSPTDFFRAFFMNFFIWPSFLYPFVALSVRGTGIL
jgi:hypothetical protein